MSDFRLPYSESYPPSLWAPPPAGPDEPDTPPVDPDPIVVIPEGDPAQAWSKAQIIAWLDLNGVTIDKKAESTLSKAELLSMAADVLSPEPDPAPDPAP